MNHTMELREILAWVFMASLASLAPAGVYAQSFEAPMVQFNHNSWHNQARASSNSDSVLTKLGQWGWGPCNTVAVKGKYAYIGNGAMIQVLDVSDPSDPKPVGQLLTDGPVTNVVVSGNYAYTLGPLRIIDISNPTSPILLSTFSPSPVPLTSITVQGNYAYVGNLSGIIYILDVSNPLQPKIVNPAFSIGTSGEIVESIVVSKNYLYANSYDGARTDVFDISNPSSPVYDTTYAINGGSALAVEGNHLYLGNTAGFEIYDVSNPASIRYIRGLSLSGFPYSISVSDTLAYIASSAGFIVVDVADTGNIHVIAGVHSYYDSQSQDTIQFGAGSEYITSSFAYLATGIGLVSVNISQLPSLTAESYFHTAYDAWSIVTDSTGHAFIADLSGGFKILDYSDASSPQLVGQYNPDESVNDVAVENNFAYLLCDSDLQVLDISNLADPKLIGKLTFGDTISDNSVAIASFLCADGSTIYAVRKSERLFAINVADPTHPEITSVLSLSGLPMGMGVSGTHLYVASGGIQIFDISDTSTPKADGFLKTSASALCITDDRLLVAGLGAAGFSEYDISDSAAPTLKYTIGIPGATSFVEIAAENDFAYVSTGQYFLTLNISKPDSGRIIDSEDADSFGVYDFPSVAASNGVILLSVADQGVLVFKNTLDTVVAGPPPRENFQLFQNYPNPFNPSTNIQFELNVLSQVTMTVYNVLGQKVFKRSLGTLQAGTHRESLTMVGFASGVYFYRIEVITANGEKTVSTKKMELLK